MSNIRGWSILIIFSLIYGIIEKDINLYLILKYHLIMMIVKIMKINIIKKLILI